MNSIDELLPEAKAAKVGQTTDSIDELRAAIMAGKIADPDRDTETLPIQFREVESQLVEALTFQAELDKRVKELKQTLYEAMENNGIKQWKSDRMTISRILPSERQTFDSKHFKEDHEELYAQYCKASVTAGSVKITLK